MEFRTFVMLKKVICDQLLASKAKIIKRKLILSSTFKFSPFPLAIFSLVPDLSFEYDPVARVRKKYGCFAVYWNSVYLENLTVYLDARRFPVCNLYFSIFYNYVISFLFFYKYIKHWQGRNIRM